MKHLLIEDENSITLKGNIEGYIGDTPCPVIGYKSMFYGKLQIAEYVYNTVPCDEIAIQTRFDILSNSFSLSKEYIIDFLNTSPFSLETIKFIDTKPIYGIDNVYMSSVKNIYKFIKYFYHNFDNIYNKYKNIKNQEFLVFFERNSFT